VTEFGVARPRYPMTRWRRAIRTVYRRVLPRRIGLRNRILLTFGSGALILSGVLAFSTYGFTRANLLQQREAAAIGQAVANARRVERDVRLGPVDLGTLSNQAGPADRFLLLADEWLSTSTTIGPSALPFDLRERVTRDGEALVMRTRIDEDVVLVIGIPLREIGGSYFEVDALGDVAGALNSVRIALGLSAALTTLVGIGLGLVASQRVIRPLASAALAARAITDGHLDTRLEDTDDPDLRSLTTAFNEMVEALRRRVDRDARFTSDVSHELRSPLMTLAASVEVMQSRRDELPDRARAALDLLTEDVVRFQGLVEDLLEISRLDVGGVALNVERLDAVEFVRQAVGVSSLPHTEVVDATGDSAPTILGDRRRLARVIANLVDNARIHGGGRPVVRVEHPDGVVRIVVQDEGEGLIEGETSKIFERFSRGGAAGKRGGQEGAGLGLALAREHVAVHGGTIRAENRRDGIRGARFEVDLPVAVEMART